MNTRLSEEVKLYFAMRSVVMVGCMFDAAEINLMSPAFIPLNHFFGP